MSDFGRIRYEELRLDKGLKQGDIASILGIKRNTYSKWENLINDMPLTICNELGNFYKVSLDYLLGIVNENTFVTKKRINFDILAERLKKIRKETKLTQKVLSDKLGFPTSTYAQYERGERIPTTLKLLTIASFYDISFDFITGRSNKRK